MNSLTFVYTILGPDGSEVEAVGRPAFRKLLADVRGKAKGAEIRISARVAKPAEVLARSHEATH